MRVAVLVKQVPKPAELRLVGGRLVRDGVGVETNAYCRRANARAVELTAQAGTDSEVVVFTMGPPAAEDAVREMIACGAARGVLICDPALSGSDTLITARVLATAVRAEGPFDLILTGAFSLDSETGHIGVQLAELLDLPFIGPCRRLDVVGGAAVATIEVEGGYADVEVLLPAVASAAERLCAPSKASREQIDAVDAGLIARRTIADLLLEPQQVGLAASPTVVGPDLRGVADTARARRSATSIEQALRVLDELPARAPVSNTPTPRPGVEIDPAAGRVWCVPDPTAGEPDAGLLHAATTIAHSAGRKSLAVLAVSAPSARPDCADEVLFLSGATTPQDWVAPLAARLAASPPHCVIIDATNWGREVAARLAARLGWGLVGDAVELTVDGDRVVAWKSAFSGQALVPISSNSPTLLVTVKPGALVTSDEPTGVDRAEQLGTIMTTSRSRVIYSPAHDVDPAQRELLRARTLVVVGTGVPPDEYGLIDEFRALLGAGPLACTRKVTDAGWLPRSRQIGITGRSVAPELVVSVGASGKFNHAVGFRGADRVIAINHDPSAPIFDAADVGIVGDWRELLAGYREALRAIPARANS